MQLCTLIPKRRDWMLKETSLPAYIAHPWLTYPIFSLPLCPQTSRMFTAKILNAGWHNAFFALFSHPSAPYSYTESITESKNSFSHNKVSRSPNTAECHQSQLSHVQSKNGSLPRAFDLLETCLYSTGSWEIFGEKLSCIAQWRQTHKLWMGTDAVCCMPLMKLYLSWPDNSEKRLH